MKWAKIVSVIPEYAVSRAGECPAVDDDHRIVFMRVYVTFLLIFNCAIFAHADEPVELQPVEVEGQPLAANVRRLLEAAVYLGAPLDTVRQMLADAIEQGDGAQIQRTLDEQVTFAVTIAENSPLSVVRGRAPLQLQQAGTQPAWERAFESLSLQR